MKQTQTQGPSPASLRAALAVLALLVALALPSAARAQWTQPNAGNINSTNTGNVGVGTANPAYGKLQINKSVRIDDDTGSASGSDTINGAPSLYVGTTGGGGQFQYNSGGGLDLWQYNGSWRRTITFARTGFVGIGTTSPLSQFHVDGGSGMGSLRVSGTGIAVMNFRDNGAGADAKVYQWISENGLFRMSLANDAESVYVRPNILVANASGNVGIGTASPGSPLDVVYNNNNFLFGVNVKNTSTGTQALVGYGIDNAGGSRVGQFTYASPTYTTASLRDTVLFSSVGATTKLGFVSSAEGTGSPDIYFRAGGDRPDSIYIQGSTGNVGVGTSSPGGGYKLDINGGANVTGSVNVTQDINATGTIMGGNIQAKYQDVAEWVPSVQKLRAGTVVVLDSGRTNHVVASASPYDTKVAGVVSATPGVILGVAGEDKVKVATTGRVRVKVDATRGAIKIGDLLVTSEVEGVAMRSVPVDLGGMQLHRPGTIIGKALEPLEKGTGEILVLLSLQ